jgi:elongation factor Ts
MDVDVRLVKELREKTGAGVLECKKALAETLGDMEKAVFLLRQRGIAKAEKKASRSTREGVVHAYIHPPGKLGVLVELNCETDFVARNEQFKQLAKDVAMHIAAAAPMCIRREDVPSALLEREKDIYATQARSEGKPENVIERIVSGRLDKFYQEVCLLEQPFIKNPDISVGDLIKERISVIGENINVRRFVRFTVGEELESQS